MSKDRTVSKSRSPKKHGLERASVTKKKPSRKPARRALAVPEIRPSVSVVFGPLRDELDFTRTQFSRLLGFSERAVAEWESGSRTPTEPAVRSHRELERLIKALRRVMRSAHIRIWLMTPSDAFGGLKPVEVIERGESDRIWRMVYELESGSPL